MPNPRYDLPSNPTPRAALTTPVPRPLAPPVKPPVVNANGGGLLGQVKAGLKGRKSRIDQAIEDAGG